MVCWQNTGARLRRRAGNLIFLTPRSALSIQEIKLPDSRTVLEPRGHRGVPTPKRKQVLCPPHPPTLPDVAPTKRKQVGDCKTQLPPPRARLEKRQVVRGAHGWRGRGPPDASVVFPAEGAPEQDAPLRTACPQPPPPARKAQSHLEPSLLLHSKNLKPLGEGQKTLVQG